MLWALCSINIFYANSMCMKLLYNSIMKFSLVHLSFTIYSISCMSKYSIILKYLLFFLLDTVIHSTVFEFKRKMLRSFEGYLHRFSNIGKTMQIMPLLPDPSNPRERQNAFVRIARVHMHSDIQRRRRLWQRVRRIL